MKIAIASGKGGTGKTTIATNLALTLADKGKKIQLLDCDVEEPNCHIFLKPEIESTAPATVLMPKVIEEKCTGCGICAEVCEYSAIAVIKGKVLIFPELCHGCGACKMFCPEDAFIEVPREVGVIEEGKTNGIRFVHGLLNIGELMSPAVIDGVKKAAGEQDILIIDSPPGTSCPVIAAVKDAEFVLLVTEPTPFGLNDLELAVGMVRELNIPFAVAINRSDVGNEDVKKYCKREEIEIILEIPDDRRIAEAYSRGEMVIHALPEYKKHLKPAGRRLRISIRMLSIQNNRKKQQRKVNIMKEIVVISGKGGTGKTSIVAAFAAIAGKKVLADCDVDAADLHLVLNPKIEHREDFSGGKKAKILEDKCISCDRCIEECRFDAIHYRSQAMGKQQIHLTDKSHIL